MYKRQSPECCPPCGGNGGAESDLQCHLQHYLRPRFYAGQLLRSEDLSSLVHWNQQKLASQRYKHGWGVVCGFDVTMIEDYTAHHTIEVAPGYAVDRCGNDVVSVCTKTLDLRKACAECAPKCEDPDDDGEMPCPPCGEKGLISIDVCVKYEESRQHPVAVAQNPCGSAQAPQCEFSRIKEGAHIYTKCGDHRCQPSSREYDVWEEDRVAHENAMKRENLREREDIVRYLHKHPPRYLGFLEHCACEKKFSLDELRQYVHLEHHLAFHSNRYPCDREPKDTCVPLARIWMRRLKDGRCVIVEIDNHRPHRRWFGPHRLPAPFGYVNLSPWIWERVDSLCHMVKEVGCHIEGKVQMNVSDLWNNGKVAEKLKDCAATYVANCESVLKVVWGDFGVCGCRVIGFLECKARRGLGGHYPRDLESLRRRIEALRELRRRKADEKVAGEEIDERNEKAIDAITELLSVLHGGHTTERILKCEDRRCDGDPPPCGKPDAKTGEQPDQRPHQKPKSDPGGKSQFDTAISEDDKVEQKTSHGQVPVEKVVKSATFQQPPPKDEELPPRQPPPGQPPKEEKPPLQPPKEEKPPPRQPPMEELPPRQPPKEQQLQVPVPEHPEADFVLNTQRERPIGLPDELSMAALFKSPMLKLSEDEQESFVSFTEGIGLFDVSQVGSWRNEEDFRSLVWNRLERRAGDNTNHKKVTELIRETGGEKHTFLKDMIAEANRIRLEFQKSLTAEADETSAS